MSKTFTITLDGQEYTMRPFNMGELEEVAELDLPRAKMPFALLRLAMKRADPPCPSVDAIEMTPDEFNEAVGKVMVAAGMRKVEAGPSGEASPATGAA